MKQLLIGIMIPFVGTALCSAMFYVVIEDLIPDMQGEKHSNLPSLGFTVGFVIMMILDVALGQRIKN